MDEPSDRLIDQRTRNRIMEVLEILADGDDGVRLVGPTEVFNLFYDWVPHRDDGGMYPNGAVSDAERALLAEVSRLVDDACDATPRVMDTTALVATGWPARIAPAAATALAAMLARGRFSEEREEAVPSG